jgi:3-hydroxyisobutyrate dehydrogenase-like beta-hydroxyacid dehydrogenase
MDGARRTIGVLFPGSMGAALAASAASDGVRVVHASAGRSAATRVRAQAAGIEDVASLDALVSAADAIVSICPPAIAEDVARAVAAAGFGGLYVDANAIAPARAISIGRLVEATGARFADGGVIGPPPREAGTTRLYLSGPGAEEAAVLLGAGPLETVPLARPVGAASGLKLAYAGFNKISHALAAQAWALAATHGVEDALAREAADLGPGSHLADRPGLARTAARAWRWAPEMDEIGDACEASGLPDGMARGAAELFARWEAHRDDDGVPLEALLAELRHEAAPT